MNQITTQEMQSMDKLANALDKPVGLTNGQLLIALFLVIMTVSSHVLADAMAFGDGNFGGYVGYIMSGYFFPFTFFLCGVLFASHKRAK